MAEDSSTVLRALLDSHLGDGPVTRNQLTNHLPMALVAKERLGADGDELRRFATKYTPRVAPQLAPSESLTAKTWTTALGRSDESGSLLDYFTKSIATNGVDEVMRQHLPALLPGIGGAAFHGVIRLSYALDVASPERIAAGLGYLAESAVPLGPLVPHPSTKLDLASVIESLTERGSEIVKPDDGNITKRMQFAAHDQRFQEVLANVDPASFNELDLTDAVLRIFASTGDFTALHGVTGMAALNSIRPWIDDLEGFDTYCLQAVAAAYLSIGAPAIWTDDRLEELIATTNLDVETIAVAGANSDDEHVAKLVYTALEGFQRTGNPLYRAVAAREASLSS